ncbi:hypothetical protein ATJ88_2498 [Isoptericola jiangsuensis]|uniref:TrbL/VirB6 plasmid conjugal transfer protein n=1 Tax=Isoptericola jiangsuensis TaxID=548579 RepID=A0A2A9EY41_9MICO|nr:hypothetical protein [Isoptericola jiangsuensis]PFG43788.1 hypothetical protein ATJ88_2498 [Isoptericola jiangsuensis]
MLVPAVVVAATLASGSWWNPLDWEGFVDGIVEGMGEALVWLLNLAFNNPLTVISASEWQAAFGQAAKWGGVFAVVAVAVCAVEIIAGMISSDHSRILRGWVWAILAWPLTAASLLLYSRLVNASDWLTTSILNSITAPEVVAGSAVVTGATSAATTAMVSMLLGVSAVSTWWLALIFVGLAMLPVIGLVIVLGAVTFGQIALAGFAPVALMLIGFRGTRPMSSKWLQMAVALLLTKPIAAGTVALGCALGSRGGADGLILGIIAITVAVASPALAFSFVGFAGAQLGGAITAHADKIKGLSNSLTHAGANQGIAALRERLGGSAKDAAAIAGAGAGSIAGFSGFGSTTAGAEPSRPSTGDPHSTAPVMAAGKGDRRTGMNGSGKTINGKARGSSDSVAHSGNAAGLHGSPSSRGRGTAAASGVADPAGHDEAKADRGDVSPSEDGWQGDAVPTLPVDGGLEHGDEVTGLGGPVDEAAWPPVGHDGSNGSDVQPLDSTEAAGAARSGVRGTTSATGGPSPSPSDSGTSPSGGRHDATTTTGEPTRSVAPRRSGADDSGTPRATTPGSGTAESETGRGPTPAGSPARAGARPNGPVVAQPNEPQRQAQPTSSNPQPAVLTPHAEPETESGPNPFGGAR